MRFREIDRQVLVALQAQGYTKSESVALIEQNIYRLSKTEREVLMFVTGFRAKERALDALRAHKRKEYLSICRLGLYKFDNAS